MRVIPIFAHISPHVAPDKSENVPPYEGVHLNDSIEKWSQVSKSMDGSGLRWYKRNKILEHECKQVPT